MMITDNNDKSPDNIWPCVRATRDSRTSLQDSALPTYGQSARQESEAARLSLSQIS